MEQLNRTLTRDKYRQSPLPEKVLIFGESALLRGLACVAFNELNKQGFFGGSVTVVSDNAGLFAKQDGLFTVVARGVESGEKTERVSLVTCVSDYINPYTDYDLYFTRAKNPELRFIVYEKAKSELIKFLYERFVCFNGDAKKGLIFLPCREGYSSGAELKMLVQKCAADWNLSREFTQWAEHACFFASTLTDRLFAWHARNLKETEKIEKKLGYRDELLTVCELFYYWAIEAPVMIREEIPLDKSGLNVVFSEDITPHSLRKSRLLDGALDALAPAALLHGFKTTDEALGNPAVKKYIEKALFKEIIPTLDINRNVLDGFAKTAVERLSNPLIKHELLAAAQNCAFKFKENIFPAIIEFQKKFGTLPPALTFSFAALIAFHKNGGRFPLDGDERNITFLRDNKIEVIFKNIGSAWGVDLPESEPLFKAVEEQFNFIKKHGVKVLIERIVAE